MQTRLRPGQHDVAISNCRWSSVSTGRGCRRGDGPTHHGAYDILYALRAPSDRERAMNESELRTLMYTAQLDTVKEPFVHQVSPW